MSPLQREAAIWLGGAILLALLISIFFAVFLPELDLLSLRYEVL